MKALVLATLVLGLLSFNLSFADSFPAGPVIQLTPGKLCDKPNSTRYPEKIAYCGRNVAYELKKQIIENYDRAFGFTIETMQRDQFKIDHYIPLCAGGSNDVSNLWPQHVSVYTVTDPLEALVCNKMAHGKLLQKDAVAIIVEAKAHLDEVPQILAHVNSL
jgi:hypothetical protein